MGSDCDKARVEGSRSQSLFCVSPHVATNSAPRRSHLTAWREMASCASHLTSAAGQPPSAAGKPHGNPYNRGKLPP